ncbi:MAG: ATP-binding cassette domain-containing protein [Alphaproteobacteria bacterium]|nr:ATP-binding cassette domain-containing protein [Alphaproteobacteria bacterium]
MTDTLPKASANASRPSLRSLLPLAPYAVRHRLWILAALISLTVASAATLTVPLALRGMVDHGFTTETADLINWYFGAMALVVTVLSIASASRYYLVMSLGERVVADLRRDVFIHLARLDASFYDQAKIGELLSRLTADTTQMKSAFGASASMLLRNLFLFFGAIIMMIFTSAKLSALVLIAIPVIVFPLVASGRSVRARSRAAQDSLADATAFASENLGAVRTMQSFNAQGLTSGRFTDAIEEAYVTAKRALGARAILTMIAIFLAFSSVIAVLWLGAHDVLEGRISGGLLSQFVLYAVFGASSLGQLSEVWSELSAAAGAAGRIAEILAVRPGIVAPDHPLPMPEPARGEIVFDHVSFAYPTRPETYVLKDISLHIRPGETIAIVGPSGGGKSTLFQLLMRFYDPLQGSIRIDGVTLTHTEPDLLRARMALVPQDPVIFGASVKDNIEYGRPHAPMKEIQQAAERAAASDFIEALPEGYDTRLGERGVTLSGGQRQRLAIARAILKDSPILLLDEATSALDAENETLVQKALDQIMQNRTTLVIAHRLATVLKADRILVMEAGQIVEEGTHHSLVAANGLYARLARLQFEAAAAL